MLLSTLGSLSISLHSYFKCKHTINTIKDGFNWFIYYLVDVTEWPLIELLFQSATFGFLLLIFTQRATKGCSDIQVRIFWAVSALRFLFKVRPSNTNCC